MNAPVFIIQMKSSFTKEVIRKVAEAARAGKPYGIMKWVFVSRDIKGITPASAVRRTDGIDVKSFRNHRKAKE